MATGTLHGMIALYILVFLFLASCLVFCALKPNLCSYVKWRLFGCLRRRRYKPSPPVVIHSNSQKKKSSDDCQINHSRETSSTVYRRTCKQMISEDSELDLSEIKVIDTSKEKNTNANPLAFLTDIMATLEPKAVDEDELGKLQYKKGFNFEGSVKGSICDPENQQVNDDNNNNRNKVIEPSSPDSIGNTNEIIDDFPKFCVENATDSIDSISESSHQMLLPNQINTSPLEVVNTTSRSSITSTGTRKRRSPSSKDNTSNLHARKLNNSTKDQATSYSSINYIDTTTQTSMQTFTPTSTQTSNFSMETSFTRKRSGSSQQSYECNICEDSGNVSHNSEDQQINDVAKSLTNNVIVNAKTVIKKSDLESTTSSSSLEGTGIGKWTKSEDKVSSSSAMSKIRLMSEDLV